MSVDKLIAALIAERFGPLREVRQERSRRPKPAPRPAPKPKSAPVPVPTPARRWVCAGCGAPAHPEQAGWHCVICHWSAYQTAPEVDRAVVS